MTYTEDSARASVAPPNWSGSISNGGAPVTDWSISATDGLAPVPIATPTAAEAAVRWRLGAATIDNLIVYVAYFVLCGVLHWRVASLGHVWALVLGGVAYHFALESRDGQTIGKRRYGIRVVSLDGEAPSARAVAIRSVLRLIDQLPVWYLSGLVSMVRTGPDRRQRIGDVAAGTMVVATDRRAAQKGTPGWYLPTATLVATAFSALSLFSVTQAGSQPLNSTQQAQFIAGCQNNPGSQFLDCGCLLNRLEAAGYVTPKALEDLIAQAEAVTPEGSPNAARAALVNAARPCRR
jgi:uncharacterized RDD family membrane protein YckC